MKKRKFITLEIPEDANMSMVFYDGKFVDLEERLNLFEYLQPIEVEGLKKRMNEERGDVGGE